MAFVLLAGAALAQPAQEAGAVADAAVVDWAGTSLQEFADLSGLGTVEVCELLPVLLFSPPPPAGTRVNVDDRLELDPPAAGQRVFTYSAAGHGGQLGVVQVTLQEQTGSWQVQRVGFRQPPPGGLRAWVQTQAAAWTFGLLSLAVLVLLLVPGSWLRRLLGKGLQVISQHRRVYVFTLTLLGAAFILGAIMGRGLPQECNAAIMETVQTAVTSVGAAEAYDSGNMARAATVTFHQNFMVVTGSTLFSLALLFGVPAYLFGTLSFFLQAIPFGLLAAGPLEIVLVTVLLLLELSAYFTMVAGGGFLLATLIRKGFSALPEAIGKVLLMLPIAGVLLLIGAWYEAFVLIGLG